MKASFLIIAAALFSGTVSAQSEVKADHNSNTSVNADLSPKNTKLSTTHSNGTSVKTSKGSVAQVQSSANAEVNPSNTIAKTNATVHKTADVTASHAAHVTKATRSAAMETGAKVKTGARAARVKTKATASTAANTSVKATKMTTAKVRNATPKANVKVISNSALSIKR